MYFSNCYSTIWQKSISSNQLQQIARSQQHIAFPDLDEANRNEPIRWEKYVMAILERGVNKSTAQVLEPIIQDVYDRIQISEDLDREIKNKPKPSHITVYRWLKKYKQSEVKM